MLRYSVFGADMLRLVADDHRRRRHSAAAEREVSPSCGAGRRAIRRGRRAGAG